MVLVGLGCATDTLFHCAVVGLPCVAMAPKRLKRVTAAMANRKHDAWLKLEAKHLRATERVEVGAEKVEQARRKVREAKHAFDKMEEKVRNARVAAPNHPDVSFCVYTSSLQVSRCSTRLKYVHDQQ